MYGIRLGDCVMCVSGDFRRREDCQDPARFDSATAAAIWILDNRLDGATWVML